MKLPLLGFVLFMVSAAAQDILPVISVDNPPNSAAQQAKPYVVMVSLDAFRYDYPVKFGATHLLALGAAGASTPEGMIPSYPAMTYPNHTTLVTGLYPEHHGIVNNNFLDPSLPEGHNRYWYNKETTREGSWYGGTPLWVLAEQQGMRSASVFWPGSDAEIQGRRPSYYEIFDDKFDDEKRVAQVIAWLKLPPELRPHFITLYYSNVDHAGHDFGPDSQETAAAVHHVDDLVGELWTKLQALKLPVDLIVVADHGMVNYQPKTVTLSAYTPLADFQVVDSSLYAKTEADARQAYDDLRKHDGEGFHVYRRRDVPASLHFDGNAREGDPVVVLTGPFYLNSLPAATAEAYVQTKHIGGHGFDPRIVPEMKAIFFAAGPDVRSGVKLPSFENVNVYPFVADILGLRAPIVDGRLSVLANARTKAR